VPGYAFVSYSRKDAAYVGMLTKYLREAGVDVWVDDAIDFGDRWEQVIKAKVDGCSAMVVVMTPDAEESTWVANEINRARIERNRKPILPLLLAGEVFFALGHAHYEDVTGGRMPSSRFLDRVRNHLGLGERAAAPPPPRPPLSQPSASPRSPMRVRPTSVEARRVDELRRTFQLRRFGSGYDPAQVDALFDRVVSALDEGHLIDERELNGLSWSLVPGGYFEIEVDSALSDVRDMMRARLAEKADARRIRGDRRLDWLDD
jgi:DivIVA domain-containing protein